MRDDGITVLTSSTPVRVESANGGRLRLTVRTEDGERQLEGSHLLSAIGRIPNTEALTPEAAGIRLNDRGFIEVNEYLETSVPGVYAMGDIKGDPAFTHLSYDDYRILHANPPTSARIYQGCGTRLLYPRSSTGPGAAEVPTLVDSLRRAVVSSR